MLANPVYWLILNGEERSIRASARVSAFGAERRRRGSLSGTGFDRSSLVRARCKVGLSYHEIVSHATVTRQLVFTCGAFARRISRAAGKAPAPLSKALTRNLFLFKTFLAQTA